MYPLVSTHQWKKKLMDRFLLGAKWVDRYFPTPIEDTKVDPPNLIRNVYSFDAQHNAIHFGHYKDEESNDS
jgi:hypothetical protein